MLSPSLVDRIRELHSNGRSPKAIAKSLNVAPGSVRRYLDPTIVPGLQVRPSARLWDQTVRDLAHQLYHSTAAGNAVVVRELLHAQGYKVPLRTLQAFFQDDRNLARSLKVATTRFETPPGHQMQIDFGEKPVLIAGSFVTVHFLSAVLGHSRRLFCRPFLAERQDEWLEGIQEAFEHFGGMPHQLLCDNTKPLVLDHDVLTKTVTWNPTFAAFCKDRGLAIRACLPRRARTKGKIERVIGYIKGNALANRPFESFEALRRHLVHWSLNIADQRIHATTRRRPADLFQEVEKTALRPLPSHALAVRTRRLTRKVSTDCFVDVDTVRYSVPYLYVRETVEVTIQAGVVTIWRKGQQIAVHRRCEEPHAMVREPAHFAGLFGNRNVPELGSASTSGSVDQMDTSSANPFRARSLDDYAKIVEGGQP